MVGSKCYNDLDLRWTIDLDFIIGRGWRLNKGRR